MFNKSLHEAVSLFKVTSAENGSYTAKLQDFRIRQAQRVREARIAEKHLRLEKRAGKGGSAIFAR
ncbi:hypothetical protein ABID21_003829 [Pseudorhizobium tarimense]|uniref:Transposase n=1 Tax=Pseudorhizobium tarimense TaxID=1079109 RepID=A0ABV2HAY0_9HYPH|nr:hypothetical protein [Pseudorhizobium tarimense]MCJ8520769.1 hypothetical protein [Pseudorhizobium tarimense]